MLRDLLEFSNQSVFVLSWQESPSVFCSYEHLCDCKYHRDHGSNSPFPLCVLLNHSLSSMSWLTNDILTCVMKNYSWQRWKVLIVVDSPKSRMIWPAKRIYSKNTSNNQGTNLRKLTWSARSLRSKAWNKSIEACNLKCNSF